ncbi:DNA polymerase IV [Sandaracinobacter sp. RS1-74]|uniref:DNA polymerase Y family protein n=1 Tax=Sandaracinobacteroides sayramensis TaxID=2913411 RepID=UPI001EDA4AE3|nr:DNA polymerase IV [Sandaracinobacteroides sayramensis]MCG2840388.1 DNA polymerase IV [Sandaracinobacteroides sayramensis]
MSEERPLRWLYLDLNSYFASVEQQLVPELRGKPVAVGPESVNSGTVIAASYEAKAYGIKTGMKVAEARARCPQLIFSGQDHRIYAEFHEKILEEVWRHIPVTQVCSIDEVACRLLDNENGRAKAIELARRIKAGIRANVGECLTSSVGIAPSRLLAKMAADMQKPDGLTLIEAGDLPHALLPLGLRDIPGIGPRMEARLNGRGIRSMAQLLSRSPLEAGSAWGSVVGTRLWYALNGHDLPETARKSRSIGHSHVLSPDTRDPENSRQTARRLLLKAASRLRRGQYVTRYLTLGARFESRRKWSATQSLPETDDSFPLLEALAKLWPQLIAHQAELSARDRVHTISVSLEDIRPAPASEAKGQQLHLFDDKPRSSLAVARALDAINARYGHNSVTLGPAYVGRANLIGAKIAFGRIPEAAEFHE